MRKLLWLAILLLPSVTYAAPPNIDALNAIRHVFASPQSSVGGGGPNFASPGPIGSTTPSSGVFTSITDTGISGSTQCVQANAAGLFSGTGAACGAGGAPTLNAITAANGTATIASGNNPITWNWAQTTDAQDAFAFGETSAATGGTLTNGLANQAELAISTATNSTAAPLEVVQGSITNTVATPLAQFEGTWNNAGLTGEGLLMNITNTASAAGSNVLDLRVGNSAVITTDKLGNTSIPNSAQFCVEAATTAGDCSTSMLNDGVYLSASQRDIVFFNSRPGVGSIDGNISRVGAGIIGVGTGAAGSVTGTLDLTVIKNGCGAIFPSVNVTPITTSGGSVTTDQNMMTLTLAAGCLNSVGRTMRVYTVGVYSTAAASSSAQTLEVKLCTVSGCGSGTVIDLCDITTSTLGAITVANNTWKLECMATTQTGGASAVFERSGTLTMDLLVGNAAADSIFLDPNATAVTSAIDSTASLFLQISGAFSAASASNTMTERQLVVEMLN